MSTNFSRRSFLKFIPLLLLGLISVALGLSKFLNLKNLKKFKGKVQGANAKIGHMMRMRQFPVPTETITIDTVIVGGGMSGLSAAWWLDKNKKKDFVILELDQKVGGNSQSGENQVSAYPWAAHYVPLPGEDAVFVRELFEELGVITGYKGNLPTYNEFYLCSDPFERVYFQGKWHTGLFPENSVSPEDKRQYGDFFRYMTEMSETKGRDGKWAMTIPLEMSSADEQFRKLDRVSFAQFLADKKWNSRYLRWYVDYCCRDDYGQSSDQVSAWAGIHYFASRSAKATNSGKETVLTWPEGNGWIVNQLQKKFPDKILKNSMAFNIKKEGEVFLVSYFDVETKKSYAIKTQNVIYAAPRFTAKYILDENVGKLHDPPTTQVPWLVANITVDRKPEGVGADLAWDNVSFYSKSLGYIVSTHQNLKTMRSDTVLTYYLPLNDHAPLIERRLALQRDFDYWANLVAEDLERMHPGIESTIQNIDVWVWGHGMISPGINYLWSSERAQMLNSMGNLHFAHTDMSGVSIFEEAQFRGVMAAKKVLEIRS